MSEQENQAPPDHVIAAAVACAQRSPCAKSKRGAVVYDPADPVFLYGSGWNGQPAPFVCTDDASCRDACGRLCVHAEARAIRGLGPAMARGLELVHVKVIDGALVAGGGPSCWQCSREILDVGLAAVWLFEHDDRHPASAAAAGKGTWRRYTTEAFHRTTLRNAGIAPGRP